MIRKWKINMLLLKETKMGSDCNGALF